MPAGWGPIACAFDGIPTPPMHAVLTGCGTWQRPGQGYASNTVSGLYQYVDDMLCYEVPIQFSASFGPVDGPIGAKSYQQSINDGIAWTTNWLADNPTQTFALGGYSQGGELVSRIYLALCFGSLQQYLPNFIGGYTFGNPSRGVGFHAPTIADPGGRGISSVIMTELPTVDGRVVWADYVHSPANGDAGLDMYASVPDNQTGVDMTLVYSTATNLQFNNLPALTSDLVDTFLGGINDLGLPVPKSAPSCDPVGWLNALNDERPASLGAGLAAAFDAAVEGVKFLAAAGGPTAPHISYLGEIAGYSNLVADAVGFLKQIAILTPPRQA